MATFRIFFYTPFVYKINYFWPWQLFLFMTMAFLFVSPMANSYFTPWQFFSFNHGKLFLFCTMSPFIFIAMANLPLFAWQIYLYRDNPQV